MKKMLSVIFLLVCVTASAYNLRNIAKKEGLTNNSVLSLHQDSKGFIWIGTCEGLNIFNGFNARTYNHSNENMQINGQLIFSSLEIDEHTFAVLTNYGLNIINKNSNKIELYEKYNINTKLKKSKNTPLYFISEDSELVYLNTNYELCTLPLNDLKFLSILDYSIDSKNRLWIFSKGNSSRVIQLEVTKSGEFKTIGTEQALLQNQSMSAAQCLDDFVLMIDPNGMLIEFDMEQESKKVIYSLQNYIKNKGKVESICKLDEDYIIGFARSGVSILQKEEHTNKMELIETEITTGIFCMMLDRKQNLLWIGTDGQGVFIYSKEEYSIRSYLTERFAPKVNNPIRAIYYDDRSNLWLGTKGNGIIKINNYNIYHNIEESDVEIINSFDLEQTDNSVFEILPDKYHKGIAWLGTEKGLSYLNLTNNKITNINFPIKYIYSICQTDPNTLWAASVGYGIYKIAIKYTNGRIDGRIEELFAIDNNEISSNYFFKVTQKNDSILILSNRSKGCYTLNINTSQIASYIDLHNKASNTAINDIFAAISQQDQLWLATGFGLVNFSEKEGVKTYNKSAKLLYGHSIQGIMKDNDANIWAATCNGIVKLNPQTNNTMTLNNKKGLLVEEFSNGAYFYDTVHNILFFGGINGFVAIERNNKANLPFAAPLELDFVNVAGANYSAMDVLDEDNKLTLDYTQNIFSLTFGLLDYMTNVDYVLEYTMDEDKNWISNENSNTIYFTGMSEGSHQLDVRYLDNNTGLRSEPFTIKIEITPPFYRSTLAYVIFWLLFTAVIVMIVVRIIRKNKRKHREKLEKMARQHKEDVYETKIRLFNNIAKEFTTPLTIIHSPCEKIGNYSQSDDFIKKNMAIIKENCDKMNELINEFMEFKESQEAHKHLSIEKIDISPLTLSKLIQFKDSMDEKGIDFKFDIETGIYWNLDKKLYISIINNLISNAVKECLPNGAILLQVTQQEEKLRINIIYHGRNMTQKEMSMQFNRHKLFNDLGSGEEIMIGNKLSLLALGGMVEQLGGTIETSVSKHNSITISLPQNKISAPKGDDKDGKKKFEQLDTSKNTILIVDYDKEMLNYYLEIFKDTYNVITLANPMQTVEKLLENSVALLLIDVHLINIDDFEIIKAIRRNKTIMKVPIIATSGKWNETEKVNAIKAGVQMYITKPFSDDFLISAVNNNIVRNESLKEYLNSPISAYETFGGKIQHVEHKRFFQQITEIISANIDNSKLSSEFIADCLNMSVRQLYRKTKDIGVSSPSEIIRDMRLQYASKLLINTKMTIDEVLYNSGFTSRAPFFKLFQQKYGASPGTFRKENLKGDIQ